MYPAGAHASRGRCRLTDSLFRPVFPAIVPAATHPASAVPDAGDINSNKEANLHKGIL
ncbi:hypothetical protein OpiT1DRAFT_01329 [Opitutaceae bacterium TAV1]|nr:hypothetical protein OpiT1DRAFT_01329 [Opitutaceae bacterium TAV1]